MMGEGGDIDIFCVRIAKMTLTHLHRGIEYACKDRALFAKCGIICGIFIKALSYNIESRSTLLIRT